MTGLAEPLQYNHVGLTVVETGSVIKLRMIHIWIKLFFIYNQSVGIVFVWHLRHEI